MKDYFSFCDAGLPAEPYASRYEIIVRCCEFLDGQPFGEPEYRITRARYEGNGLWREIRTVDELFYPEDDEYETDVLVTSGMVPEYDLNPEYFEFGGNADLKRGEDVVAWYPFPALPDLSNIRPMVIH